MAQCHIARMKIDELEKLSGAELISAARAFAVDADGSTLWSWGNPAGYFADRASRMDRATRGYERFYTGREVNAVRAVATKIDAAWQAQKAERRAA